jgi:hypothetical protein
MRVIWGLAGCVVFGVLYHKKATRLRLAKEKQAQLEANMDAELAKAGLPPLKELGGDLNEWQLDAYDVKCAPPALWVSPQCS